MTTPTIVEAVSACRKLVAAFDDASYWLREHADDELLQKVKTAGDAVQSLVEDLEGSSDYLKTRKAKIT